MNLKQNTKFIWVYVAILFSFALILILFAGLTQNNYQKEITDQQTVTAGVKKSLSALSNENEKLKDKIKDLQTQNEQLKNENAALLLENDTALSLYEGDILVTKTLIKAYGEKNLGQTDLAKEIVKELDISSMTEKQKNLYNIIIGE